MKMRNKSTIAIITVLALISTIFAGMAAFGNDTVLLRKYTFENGMPAEFTPLSYDGMTAKPKIVKDGERGYVLRQYFGAGTGYGDGDPASESYVSISENPYAGRRLSTGATFMLWVKTEDNAAWDYNDTILSFNAGDMRFALNDCPYLNFNDNATGNYHNIYTNDQQSIKGKWLHYAFTLNTESIKIYINGVEVGCNEAGNIDGAYDSILDFISDGSTSLNLGLGGFFGSQDCYMDDLRFYSGTLSAEDIFEIYTTTVDYTTLNSKTVSHAGVHDPSIVTCYILEDGTEVGENDPRAAEAVDKKWWIFGSHMGVAYSDDLINWHNYAGGFDENNPLINYTDEYGNEVKYTDMFTYDLGYHGSVTGMWAGCAIWNVNLNKWCLYGSCTSVLDVYGYNSVLWVMYADKIEGPYKDPEPMVFTNPSFNVSNSQNYIASHCPDGASYTDKSWWNNTQRTTHTVDPTVFFDEDGKLWMIYGSYNSIFILPMDEETGLPDYEESYQRELAATNAGKNNYANNDWYSDWYWGTRINYTNYATDFTGEGTFVYYDHVTDYYYLYITYGGFAALGGYNLRVLRSENPEGPYVDALGQDLISVLDTDSTPVNAGVKLTGNYQWSCNSVAYMSPGHDSVLEETVDGVEKIFQMYHVRFNNKSEGFFDQLHQMARTKDGWTIMLPYEYYGETIEYDTEYSMSEIAGAYEFIDLKTTTYHIKDESDYDSGSDIVLPTQTVVLSEDGKIYGVASYKGGTTTDFANARKLEKKGIIGTWSEDEGSCYADFTIDGVNYTGLFTYQYDESKTREKKLVFAATGSNRTIWGSKIGDGAFVNAEETNPALLKQVNIDGGEISDSGVELYGNAAVVGDLKRGSALFLPENDEGYATLDNPYYGKTLDSATITFWGKVTEQADYDAAGIFMSFIDSPDEWKYFTLNAGVQAHIFHNGFADFYSENAPSFTFNEWHCFALTVDGSDTLSMYIDGVKIGYAVNQSDDYNPSNGSILDLMSQTQKIYLGKTQQPQGAEWAWTGQECFIDNICFYSSILTPTQMTEKLLEADYTLADSADESIKSVTVDPVVYTHGTGSGAPYLYSGNIISTGSDENERITYLTIPDDYELLSMSSDNGVVEAVESKKGLYLRGNVTRTNTDMALTLYLKKGRKIYRKTLYTYVMDNPVDAHVVEWNCINASGKRRSLCHVSRLVGSTGSGGSGNFTYLDNPTGFYDASDSDSGMQFASESGAKITGAYAYGYSSVALLNKSITNGTVPNAVYYIDKSGSCDNWDGSQYRFIWRFTTLNGNSSAIQSTGRNVYGESNSSAVNVDVSAGVYDDSPNISGQVRDYYITGSSTVVNNTVTVSMTQGSSPKASVNHKVNLSVYLFDKSMLRNALDGFESYYCGAYSSDSWEAFESAKRSAYAYLNNYTITDDSAATQQAYIDALAAAANALEVVDYSELETIVENAKALSPDSFTDASFNALISKALEYEALIGGAVSQSQIDSVVATLTELFSGLVNAYIFSGTVTDTLGNPIENAEVSCAATVAATDGNGDFRAKLESGEYTFTVSTDTSIDATVTVTVTDGAVSAGVIAIVNCDMNRDGYINGRDWAYIKSSGNAAARQEFSGCITTQ